jgi:hypothetical protein
LANEAILDFESANAIPFTIADGVAVEKGAALRLLDPMTLSGSGFVGNDLCGGIATVEKIVTDGVTSLGVYREGRFKVLLSGSCNVGDQLTTSSDGGNYFRAIKTFANGTNKNVWGAALETGSTAETIFMELDPFTLSGSATV